MHWNTKETLKKERKYYNSREKSDNNDEKELNEYVKLHKKYIKRENSVPVTVFQIIFWKLVGLLLIFINLIFPALICIRTAWGIFIESLWGLDGQELYNFLNPNPMHDTGLLNTVIDFILIVYISVSAFVGYYNMEWLSPIHPKIKETPISIILLNSFLIIIVSSSLPAVARILGIMRFELMGNFETMFYLINHSYLLMYKSSFLCVLASKYLKIFPIWKNIYRILCQKIQKKITNYLLQFRKIAS